MTRKQRLLVSIRGPNEALHCARGGAAIADVEYPASALGTPYPLNILAVRQILTGARFGMVAVSTNIGEIQSVRASACQAALGVAVAGADLIKFGLAGQSLESAIYLGKSIVRTVRTLGSKSKRLYPAIFVDDDMRRFLDPLKDAPALAKGIGSDGVLIDTFNKTIGKGLLDFCTVKELSQFTKAMHRCGKEAWIAGSITLEELPDLWATGVDVICVRGAACAKETGKGRFGEVSEKLVRSLVETMPGARRQRKF